MKKLKALLLISFLAVTVLLPTAPLAVQVVPPYPASFWVNGTLLQGGAPGGVSGYKAVFYKTSGKPEDGYALNISDNNGDFRINALDDLRMLDNNGNLAAGSYFFGVVSKDGFGINEKPITLAADPDLKNGYYIVSSNLLTLKQGQGIPDPSGPTDNGYIKSIYVYKQASKIMISWKYKDPSVLGAVIWKYDSSNSLFSKTGSGWSKIADIASPLTSYDLGPDDGLTTYYMVLPKLNGKTIDNTNMFDPAPTTVGDYLGKDTDPNKTPWTSWPGVKFALVFQANETKLMGYQFYPTGANGFIKKLSEITASAGYADGSVWVNISGLQRLDCTNGTWSGDFDVALGSGYWLKSTAPNTYTFTGALIGTAFDKDMIMGSDMYSYAFPAAISQATLFVGGGFSNNDSIWINKGGLQRLDYTGSWSGNFTLDAGDGFWYKNSAANKRLKTIP